MTRSCPETIPDVADPAKSNPNGFPIAITVCPTFKSSVFPNSATASTSTPLTYKTAKSV